MDIIGSRYFKFLMNLQLQELGKSSQLLPRLLKVFSHRTYRRISSERHPLILKYQEEGSVVTKSGHEGRSAFL
jgi:hypothetical protein